MRQFFGLLLLLSLTSCSSLLGVTAEEHHWYQIPAMAAFTPVEASNLSSKRLLVKDARADSFVNTHKIIFSADGVEQGSYQFASWVEPPPSRFTQLLVQGLGESKIFTSVSPLSSSTLADLQLNTGILECYHDTSSAPGQAKIRIVVELVNMKNWSLVEQTTFERAVPVAAYDSRGAVDALAKAVHLLVGDIISWLSRQPPLPEQSQPSSPSSPPERLIEDHLPGS